jgi:hypothetical protein
MELDMKTKTVKLTKRWSGHEAGEVIELEAGKAGRICDKGFGIIVKPGRRVETADAPPAAEKAVVTPKLQQTPTPEPSDEEQ